jgi:hypothetical protein
MKNQKRPTGSRFLQIVAAAALLGAVSVSAMEPEEMVDQEVYTLTNLHPDEENQRLYSTNYNLPGTIKVCTKVKITSYKKKKMKFVVVDRDREYDYLLHRKSTPEGFVENIKRYFGPECPAAEIETLSEIDQEGIKKGRGLVGMSRRGIILAMGYPPQHVTPDLEYDEWMYWMNRFNRDAVVFDEEGIVIEVRH